MTRCVTKAIAYADALEAGGRACLARPIRRRHTLAFMTMPSLQITQEARRRAEAAS